MLSVSQCVLGLSVYVHCGELEGKGIPVWEGLLPSPIIQSARDQSLGTQTAINHKPAFEAQ